MLCMTRYDPTNSRCRVYTRRTGLLGAVGHDLEIHLAEYRIEVAEAELQVYAMFSAGSLRVVGAVDGREPRPGKLSAKDQQQIDQHIAQDVLESTKYPSIEFHSTRVEPNANGYRVQGRLRLHGQERSIELAVQRRDAALVAEVMLRQPDFGIQPFRAFGGALRVRPDVLVCIELPVGPELLNSTDQRYERPTIPVG
jgi:hypothetical protein